MNINYSQFVADLIEFFSKTNKTSWGKNEIVAMIKDLQIEFLKAQLYQKGG